jgi:hypothetical protein
MFLKYYGILTVTIPDQNNPTVSHGIVLKLKDKKCVSSQKRGETSRRFERLNQFFEETFGTVCPYSQNIEKIQKR